jgi:hypothetical protein
MEGKNIYWDWNPLISVGPFKFGESAKPLIQEYGLRELEKPFEEADWNSYEFPDCETRVYTNKELKIDSIGCFDNIYYKGQNLFGLNLDQIRNLLGEEDEIGETVLFDFEDNEYEKFPVEFEKLSLQIWFKDDMVESAMVHGLLDDD